MTHVVGDLRGQVRVALASALPGVNWPLDHWTKTTVGNLPRAGVSTPRVEVQRIDVGAVERSVDLIVVLKRVGSASVESDLDADAVTIEGAVLPVLDGLSDDYDLREQRMNVDAGAEVPVGELMMLFRVVLRTPEGDPETGGV